MESGLLCRVVGPSFGKFPGSAASYTVNDPHGCNSREDRTVEMHGLLIDPDVRRHLGVQALADVVERIEPSGDCVVCHTTLTHDQVSLTVHAAATDPLLVLPAHAACQPSALVTHPAGRRPMAPAAEYHLNLYILPIEPMLTPAGQQHPGNPTPSRPTRVPMLLINPNVDVQIGDIVDGRWQPWWQKIADQISLTRLGPLPHLDAAAAGWTIELQHTRGSTAVLLRGPGHQYRYPRADPNVLTFLQTSGTCLVMISDTVRATTTLNIDTLSDALRNGEIFGTLATLGTAPGDRSSHQHTKTATQPAPGHPSSRPRIDDLSQRLADIDVSARAAFSDHPALGLSAITAATELGECVPVLLLEPRSTIGMNRTDSGATTELRVEAAIGAGLHRIPTDDSTPPGIARDWRVLHHNGRVELTGPFGAPVARGALRLPPGWRDAAERLGRVIVVYGPRIGVRAPAGQPYNDANRRAELEETRQHGIAAWGITAWDTTHTQPSSTPRAATNEAATPPEPDDIDDLDLLHRQVNQMPRYSVYLADTVATVITPADLQPWLSQLWPVRCQTCAHALGAKADLSIDGPLKNQQYLLSLHHATCRPSSTTPPETTIMTAPTAGLAATTLGDPDQPNIADLPILMINPSCEQLRLTRTNTGWRNTTLEPFAALGFDKPSDRLPRKIRHARVRYTNGHLVFRTTKHATRANQWSLATPRPIRDHVERLDGIAVALTNTVLPTRLATAELTNAFHNPAALVGWVPLEHS